MLKAGSHSDGPLISLVNDLTTQMRHDKSQQCALPAVVD